VLASFLLSFFPGCIYKTLAFFLFPSSGGEDEELSPLFSGFFFLGAGVTTSCVSLPPPPLRRTKEESEFLFFFENDEEARTFSWHLSSLPPIHFFTLPPSASEAERTNGCSFSFPFFRLQSGGVINSNTNSFPLPFCRASVFFPPPRSSNKDRGLTFFLPLFFVTKAVFLPSPPLSPSQFGSSPPEKESTDSSAFFCLMTDVGQEIDAPSVPFFHQLSSPSPLRRFFSSLPPRDRRRSSLLRFSPSMRAEVSLLS